VLDAKLVARVEGLDAAAYGGDAFRHLPPAYDPLSGRGARIHGGRWNPPDSFSVLYLGLDRQTVVDEFERLARRQRRDPADFLPRAFYRYDLLLQSVLDLRDAEAMEAVGLNSAELTSDQLEACQRVGRAAHQAGREGILAPSAAGDGTVLALFLEGMQPGSTIAPTRMEIWESAPG
jgi:RES domain-containing protein